MSPVGVANSADVTDAAVVAAEGDMGLGALEREGARALAKGGKERCGKKRRGGGGLKVAGYGVALDDEAPGHGQREGKRGSMFAASQQIGAPVGLEFSGD